ncbi:MAG TPA: radical SAM protein [Caldilineae bacterium]|nr:radical SAM protein [Caldilineae bacterium]
MKIMLVFPPSWTPTMPHLALPTLTAYLRSHGVEVIQRDLNLEVFEAILTREHIEQVLARLREDYGPHAQRRPHRPALPERRVVQWALTRGPELAAQVEEAKATIRGEAFFDGSTGSRAFQIIEHALQIASLPFYPASLDLEGYASAFPVDSSEALLRAVSDPQHNIFIDIYRQSILHDIEREQPDIVGIAVLSIEQMLAGMTLGHLIKERGLPCHVAVGGPHITMLREQIPKVPSIFRLFDSAIVFDGEVPLLRLAEALDGTGDLSRVPNLIYRDGSQVRQNPRERPQRIADLPMPDFEGMPLNRYLAPQLVLPLLTARGCYFGQCAFCNVGYGEHSFYSQLPAEQVAEQMRQLQRRFHVRHIFFSDEAISPRTLRRLSSILATQGDPIYWGGCVRFERVITKELLESMYRGGCRMLLFGLESASEPIINRIGKGTRLEHMSRILRESAEAGIWNHTFFFFGFPGETLDDAQETVNFLYEHKPYIHSAAFGTFLLERYAPAHRFPGAYGIKRIIEDPTKDLAIYFDYEVESGMDEEMAELVASRFLDALPDKPFPHFYVNDIYRFLYASRLSRQRMPLPPWLAEVAH